MIVAAVVLVLVALFLFLSMPAKTSKEDRARFEGRNYAHRGLHGNDGELPPENTVAAFNAACEHGYGMELDVQFTSDDRLIVFHDNDYKRSSGVDRPVWECSFADTQDYRLFGRDYYTPLFADVLKAVNGRTPIIVEVKAEGRTQADYDRVCKATWEHLKDYQGDWCVESFHPAVVRWWRKNHPEVVRGQLCYRPYRYKGTIGPLLGFMLGFCLTNFYTRPNFIAYEHHDCNGMVMLNRRLGAMTVMWTCESAEEGDRLEKQHDAVIFQHYLPKPEYEV